MIDKSDWENKRYLLWWYIQTSSMKKCINAHRFSNATFHTIDFNCSIPLKRWQLQLCIRNWQLQLCIKKLTKKEVQTKVINYNSAKKLFLATCAQKSYHSFVAILWFLYTKSYQWFVKTKVPSESPNPF